MYGNLMTPTLLIVGSKNKSVGVYFPQFTMLTASQCLPTYPEVVGSQEAALPGYMTLAHAMACPGRQ